MNSIYYVPYSSTSNSQISYKPQVYELGTPKKPGWLTAQEFEASLPAPEPPTLEETRTAALEALRLRKWQAKDAGIVVAGMAIDTDDKGQATISGAVTNCLINPAFTAQWKTAATNPDGTAVWVAVGKDEIFALAAAMTAHTEACFGVEAVKQAEIAALETVEEIAAWLEESLDQGWPGHE